MNTNKYLLLNRVFSRSTFKELMEEHTEETYMAATKRYIDNPHEKNHQQIISEFYQHLKKNYRNEYFYKNTLLNKLLLGIHSPKTTTALTEVPVAKSKADFILINGKAVVYEIKTELDNFERLGTQINDYYKAFNYVSVVTAEVNNHAIEKILSDTPVGIYLLTNRNSLSVRKRPVENNASLDFNTIFKILRKSEYESILLTYYGYLPRVSQFNYYSECKKMFNEIDVLEAYKLFINELKKRNPIDVDLYSNVPYELKFLMYFYNLRKVDYKKLEIFLDSKLGG